MKIKIKTNYENLTYNQIIGKLNGYSKVNTKNI